MNSYSVVGYIDTTKNITVDYMTDGMVDGLVDSTFNGMTGDFLIFIINASYIYPLINFFLFFF